MKDKRIDWGLWAITRTGLVVGGLLIVGVWLAARDTRGADDWTELLVPHGVGEVVKIQWIGDQTPGEWVEAVAEVTLPESSDRRELFLFEGMQDADGKPFRVRRAGNLTRTPDADDAVLAIARSNGQRHLASSSALGKDITAVSLIELTGDPTIWREEAGHRRPLGDAFKLSVTFWQEMGRPSGVMRRSYVLGEPAQEVTARFDGEHVVFGGKIPGEDAPREGSVRVRDGAALDIHAASLGLVDQTSPWVIDSWIQFAVNRARAHPWVGANKIALLEKFVFDHVDAVKQRYYAVVGIDDTQLSAELAPETTGPEPEPARALELAKDAVVIDESGPWPPPKVTLPSDNWEGSKVAGEGKWRPWIPAWVDLKDHGDKPWPVYRTAFRVNETKQYEHMIVVAMDMRQFDMSLVAGIISPRSTTGYRGTGKIPRDPEVLKKVFLAFNGGFKTTHGAYGVHIDNKVFVPHKAAMATLAIYDDKAIRMGTWPGEGNFGNYREEKNTQQKVGKEAPPVPEDVVDMRQNLPPMVAGGVLNPSGAVRWGGVVDHLTGTSTPRSGACIRGDFTLMFVWGKSSSARDLGNAMIAAGCDYGMHLDMNPFHTGMVAMKIPVEGDKIPREKIGKEATLLGIEVERASKTMMFDYRRYAGRDIKDFFYLTWRDHLPERLGQPRSFEPWSTRGLPVAEAGLSPLALQTTDREGKARLLGLDTRHFKATATQTPEVDLPAKAATGQLAVELWLDAPIEPSTGAGRVALGTETARLTVEGIPSEGGDVTTALTGTTLFVNGAKVARLPKTAPPKPIIVAQTLSGDAVVITCEGCSIKQLTAILQSLDVDSAVLLGSGALAVSTRTADGAWKAVSGQGAATGAPSARFDLLPQAPRSRTGVTGFEKPLDQSP